MKKIFVTILVSFLIIESHGQSQNKNVIELGKAWAGNTVNTVIFRHHGVVSQGDFQYTAYYIDTVNMIVVKRSLENNNIESHCIKRLYKLCDSHNSISLGVDSMEYIHISYNHNANILQYRRSTKPEQISGWTDETYMTKINEDKLKI